MDELVAAAPKSVVARTEGDGFYVRIHPQPDIRWGAVGVGAVTWLAIAGGLAWLAADGKPELLRLIFGALAIFGLLLYAFHHGRQLMPVEIVCDGGAVFFAGERMPVEGLSTLEHVGSALVLRGVGGAELGRVEGVGPQTGGWVVRAWTQWRGGQG